MDTNSNSFNNDQHLTQEELVEYNQGALSNKEMHRLELHLIDCDLCNDALEGIVKVDSAAFSGSLYNIKSRTSIEEKFEITQKHWLAIAASVVLVAVVSIIFYIIPQDTPEMIAEEKVVEEIAQDRLALPLIDTASENVEQLDTVQTADSQQESLLATSTEQPQVIEAEAKATVPKTSVSEPDPIILADNNLGDEDTIGENSIATLSSSQEELDVASGARSKKTAAAPEAENIEETQAVNIDNEAEDNYTPAIPEKGQRSYDRYLKRKLQYPVNAKDNNIEGDVVLQLTIDTSGNITNVIITQSLGYGCDEEAIRLVNQGPSWNSSKRNGSSITDTVSVTIPFNL